MRRDENRGCIGVCEEGMSLELLKGHRESCVAHWKVKDKKVVKRKGRLPAENQEEEGNMTERSPYPHSLDPGQ